MIRHNTHRHTKLDRHSRLGLYSTLAVVCSVLLVHYFLAPIRSIAAVMVTIVVVGSVLTHVTAQLRSRRGQRRQRQPAATVSERVYTVGICVPFAEKHWIDSIEGTRRVSGELVHTAVVKPTDDWQALAAAVVFEDTVSQLSTMALTCRQFVIVRRALDREADGGNALVRRLQWLTQKQTGMPASIAVVDGLLDVLKVLQIDSAAPSIYLQRLVARLLVALLVTAVIAALVTVIVLSL